MNAAALCVLLPGVAAAAAAVLARRRAARWLHVAGCAATLAAALALSWAQPAAGWLGDPLSIGAAVLAAAVALGGAVAGLEPAVHEPTEHGSGGGGLADEAGPAGASGAAGAGEAARFAPVAALALLASVMLGLLADSAVAAWLAVAAAVTVASAVPLLRGVAGWAQVRAMAPAAAGALCVSLLGTVLLAAGGAACWSMAPGTAGAPGDGAMLALGCVLLLAGHALAAGLAPLHGWLGAAQSGAPREVGVMLCAPLPGLALVLLLRAGRVTAAGGAGLAGTGLAGSGLAGTGLAGSGLADAGLPKTGLLGFGLLSVLLAGLALWRPGGAGTVRLATLLHSGLAAAAFGLGGRAAAYAGLLHLAVSGLVRAAAVLAGAGGRGWLAPLVVAALAGVPPLALFPGEFLLLAEALARRPALTAALVAGLLAAAVGLLRRGLDGVGGGALGRGGAWALLAAAMLAGLALPAGLSDGLTRAAEAVARLG